MIWALAGARQEPNLRSNVAQLNKILKFLNDKGIGYKMMFHLITVNCNCEIGMPRQGSGIPFKFIRSDDINDRRLEQEIRQVRKKFQEYAYQLKITHAIEDIVIPVVRRVDKPETIYSRYVPTTSVYAGRPSNTNNNIDDNNNKTLIYDSNVNSNRTVYYQNGIV